MTATSTGPTLGVTTPYYGGHQVQNPANVILVTGTPSIHAIHNNVGTIAVENSAAMAWMLTSVSGGTATWSLIATGAGAIEAILGTTNQINASTVANTTTLSLSSTLVAPGTVTANSGDVHLNTSGSHTTVIGTGGTGAVQIGNATGNTTFTGLATLAAMTQVGTASINASGAAVTTIGTGGTGAVNIGNATGNTAVTGSLTASTTLTATAGAITATNGNLVLGTAGNKILSTSVASTTTAGANSFGSVALASGTATVATSAVTAASLIFLSRGPLNGATAVGELEVASISANTNFVINSCTLASPGTPIAADSSIVYWMIVN